MPPISHDDPSEPASDRVETEVSLLQAMYPSQILFDAHSRQISYTPDRAAQLVLRLPARYPEAADAVELVSAHDAAKNDVRDATRRRLEQLSLPADEERLDRIILAFDDLLTDLADKDNVASPAVEHATDESASRAKTVIVWLHHLLATSKRKLALSPSADRLSKTVDHAQIAGMTKPGYPGILLFSGPSALVDEHVRELRSQNWQAFQVRYDSDEGGLDGRPEAWEFVHGTGIVEVETMAEVVKGIAAEEKRQVFLQAVGVK